MRVGTFVKGIFKAMPTDMYLSLGAMSVHNQVYELRMETTPMTLEKEMDVVSKLLKINVSGMKVLGVDAKGNIVKMQVQANQFAWAAVLAILPQLIVPLIALVIGVIFISRLNEYTTPLVIIAVVGIAAYLLLKPEKKK